jgi:hypothetical protein
MLLGGCGTKKYTFSIAVKNDSPQPVVVGLAKDGPPYEDNWATPEQIATFPTRPGEHAWGVPVAPGKTAEVKEERAKLDRYGAAYVRIYASDPALSSLLSISNGSPNRLDIQLVPGDNRFIVTREGGQLSYKRLIP